MGAGDEATVEHVAVRVAGRRRAVAMRSDDWARLHRSIHISTFARLLVSFRGFCAGCDTLPEQAFRRVDDDPHGRLEQFVADGVRVIGRRGTDDGQQTFFVTQVVVECTGAVTPTEAPRQAMLPLDTGYQGRTLR